MLISYLSCSDLYYKGLVEIVVYSVLNNSTGSLAYKQFSVLSKMNGCFSYANWTKFSYDR